MKAPLDFNLSPAPVHHADGSIRHSGLDNHDMGTIFEDLVGLFNEENSEESGESSLTNLIFRPIPEGIRSGTNLLYDDACGTGGMLTGFKVTNRRTNAPRRRCSRRRKRLSSIPATIYDTDFNPGENVMGLVHVFRRQRDRYLRSSNEQTDCSTRALLRCVLR